VIFHPKDFCDPFLQTCTSWPDARLGACSPLRATKLTTKAQRKAPTLEIPPDLTQLSRESRYTVPGWSVTVTVFRWAKQSRRRCQLQHESHSVMYALSVSGNQRWLVIDRPADKLWEPVKRLLAGERIFARAWTKRIWASWKPTGLKTAPSCRRTSFETHWANSLTPFYSTGERDKFRTRLERNAAGGTDVFISHRGMIEVYDSPRRTAPSGNPVRPTLSWKQNFCGA
jgi:outer membrane protein assembly factor BamC